MYFGEQKQQINLHLLNTLNEPGGLKILEFFGSITKFEKINILQIILF